MEEEGSTTLLHLAMGVLAYVQFQARHHVRSLQLCGPLPHPVQAQQELEV